MNSEHRTSSRFLRHWTDECLRFGLPKPLELTRFRFYYYFENSYARSDGISWPLTYFYFGSSFGWFSYEPKLPSIGLSQSQSQCDLYHGNVRVDKRLEQACIKSTTFYIWQVYRVNTKQGSEVTFHRDAYARLLPNLRLHLLGQWRN